MKTKVARRVEMSQQHSNAMTSDTQMRISIHAIDCSGEASTTPKAANGTTLTTDTGKYDSERPCDSETEQDCSSPVRTTPLADAHPGLEPCQGVNRLREAFDVTRVAGEHSFSLSMH